jgi:hypothetical protein
MKVIKLLGFVFVLLISSLSSVYAQTNDSIPLPDSTVVVLDTLKNLNDTTKLALDTLQADTLSTKEKRMAAMIEAKKRGGRDKADTTETEVVQDSVETVVEDTVAFGVETTRFIYEEDLLLNTNTSHHPDTSLTYRQHYSPLQKSRYLYQDLGNLGTAIQSIAYKSPENIGTRWGVKSFDPYLTKPNEIRYFNTFSPYTSLYVAQGGQGKSYLDVVFARNINATWGFSIWYKRLTANRVIGNRFQRNDTQLTHQTVGYNTRFASKNGRYKLLNYFQFYQHETLEIGGLTLEESFDDLNKLYEVDNGELLQGLASSNTIQTGKNFHIYQQYAISKDSLLEVFHILDYNKQDNKFTDEKVGENNISYDTTFFHLDAASSFYKTKFSVLKNQVGIKGRLANFSYQAYVKTKTYDFSTRFIGDTATTDTLVFDTIDDELYLGGGLRYVFNESSYLNTSLEYLFENDLYLTEDTVKRSADYSISANFVHKNLKLSFQSKSYRPDLIQQRFYGNHFRWNNREAKNIVSQELKASYSYFHKDFAILSPFVEHTKLKNYVYYDESALAKQDTISTITYLRAGLEAKIKWKDVRSETKVIYTHNVENDIIPIPKLHINTIIYHQNPIPHAVLKSQIGLEAHWKSTFNGQNYMPATQQVYRQTELQIGTVVLLDIFFNFTVSRITISTKVSNLLDRISTQGYFETPFYMGQPRSFEFNVTWMFFD